MPYADKFIGNVIGVGNLGNGAGTIAAAILNNKIIKFLMDLDREYMSTNKTKLSTNKPTTIASGDTTSRIDITPFQIKNICDLPDIYTYLCFKAFKNEIINQPNKLISILVKLSFINIKSEEIITEFCNILKSKNISNFESFIERISNNTRVVRNTSIFRYDPASILSVFVNHETFEQACNFIRYIMHSKHLPEMESFLNQYNEADYGLRDGLVPKVIYSWHYIE